MPTIVTATGTLTDASFWRTWQRPGGSGSGSQSRWQDYASIYRTQPNVRAVVDLISRDISDLGLHLFRRVGDNDRVRITDTPLARMLAHPNFRTTGLRFFYSGMTDILTHGNTFAFKIPGVNGRMALLRVPPQIVEVQGGLLPRNYRVNLGGAEPLDVKPEQILHLRLPNPDSPILGLSPLETLRRILDEDAAAVENRGDYWRHAGRKSIVIRRPRDARPWAPDVADRFNASFTQAWKSPQGDLTPILEDGMDVLDMSFSAEQSQYAEGRRLTREEVVTYFHVPLSMGGVAGSSATFASVEMYHQLYYQDTAHPWLNMIEQDIELQLFDDFPDATDCYVEFNVMSKLQGAFTEQVKVLQAAIGIPFMTRDEGRSRLNLPAKGGDADELAVPLNIDPTGQGAAASDQTSGTGNSLVTATRQRAFARQQDVLRKRLASGFRTVEDAWDSERWDRELAADLGALDVWDPLSEARAINNEHRAQLAAVLEGRGNGHGG